MGRRASSVGFVLSVAENSETDMRIRTIIYRAIGFCAAATTTRI